MTQTVLVYEDSVHEMILRRIFEHLELDFAACNLIPSGGKSRIDKNLVRYTHAARSKRVIILRDLDNDALCAPVLRGQLLSGVDPSIVSGDNLVFRLIVREAEAWLLSDKESCKEYFKLRDSDIQRLRPESLKFPKEKLFEMIDRGGLNFRRKAEFYTRLAGGAWFQAPSYNDAIRPYINIWSVVKAMAVSKSLARAVGAVSRSYKI